MDGKWIDVNGRITLFTSCVIIVNYDDTTGSYDDTIVNENCITYIDPFNEMTTMEMTTMEMTVQVGDQQNAARLIDENQLIDLEHGVF